MAKTRLKAISRPKRREPTPDQPNFADHDFISETVMESGVNPVNCQLVVQNPNPNSGSNPKSEDDSWGYRSEAQLEEILMRSLDFAYNDAISKLVNLDNEKDIVLNAVLMNGYCFGTRDVSSNILNNTLTYLTSGTPKVEPFDDLRQLEEYCLNVMVSVLQMCRPDLSRGGAMWCLLMSGLHMKCASMIDVPVDMYNVESDGNNSDREGVLSHVSDVEIKFPKRFNLTPPMEELLKRNVAKFVAGFRVNDKYSQVESRVCSNCLYKRDWSSEEYENAKNQDVADVVLGTFREISLDEDNIFVPEDEKDEMVIDLVCQINDLCGEVMERRKWAEKTVLQALKKLCNDMRELRTLRREREESRRLKHGISTFEDRTMKRLSEMEIDFRNVSEKLDHSNEVIRCLETQNAAIRAKMEASNLNASESAKNYFEVSKKEKKYMKRLVTWEKRKNNTQEEIAAVKKKMSDRRCQMVELEASVKDAEANWRQERKAKELALAQLEEEKLLKEETKSNSKARLEELRQNIQINFQRRNDDLQRLEQELSHLKAFTELTQKSANPLLETPEREIIERMFDETVNFDEMYNLEYFLKEEEGGNGRECMICTKGEVSVVFLPCAHQVLCVNCNEEHVEKRRAMCPFCEVPIKQRIRVYEAN